MKDKGYRQQSNCKYILYRKSSELYIVIKDVFPLYGVM